MFNASRHGVNFQDSMGGESVVEGNLFFNLNRETHDTAALNSWGTSHKLPFNTSHKPREMNMYSEGHFLGFASSSTRAEGPHGGACIVRAGEIDLAAAHER